MRWNLNEFLICNSSYIYNCAQDYREAAAFAFAKKPVLHEECAMLKFGDFYLFSLVWQNVHKGHWKDPFPLWLSFNVSDLQHRRNKQTNKCPYTHRTFTDSMNSIQNQQNCTDAMGTPQVFWQLKASSVNIWVCVSEQNKILQTYKTKQLHPKRTKQLQLNSETYKSNTHHCISRISPQQKPDFLSSMDWLAATGHTPLKTIHLS